MIATGLDIPRFLVFVQEVLLVVLYSVAIGRAHARRKFATEKVIRNMFAGVMWLSFGVICKAIGISLALIFFWEKDASARLLIWECSIIGFALGGHLLVRYDYQTLSEYMLDVLHEKEDTERLLQEDR